jgi:peptide/nickel transport system permease protein
MSTTITSTEAPLVRTGLTAQERRALWIRFPRRLFFILAAFALALLVIYAIGGLPPTPDNAILDAASNTLSLLLATLFMAMLLGVGFAVIALLVHGLVLRVSWLGGFVRAIGRLITFFLAPIPVAALAFLVLLGIVFFFNQLPIAGAGSDPGTVLLALIAPATILALLPALLAAQDFATVLSLPYPQREWRHWLAAVLSFLASLLAQTGGVLSAAVVVEALFARPGLGRLLLAAVVSRELLIAMTILGSFAVAILVARLAAELLYWLADLLLSRSPDPLPSEMGRAIGPAWLVLALLLLAIPIAVAVVGLSTPAQAAVNQDLQERLAPPSLEHPLGTDPLGRDNWARASLGAANTLGQSLLAAGLILFPVIILSMLAATLHNRPGWGWHWLGDLLLLPADALLFFPVIPATLVVIGLVGQTTMLVTLIALSTLLLARAIYAGRVLWTARTSPLTLGYGLGVLLGLLVGTLFFAFSAYVSLEYLGFGLQPPAAALGSVLQELQPHLRLAPLAASMVVLLIAVCAFTLYSAAHALLGLSYSKKALVQLNQ